MLTAFGAMGSAGGVVIEMVCVSVTVPPAFVAVTVTTLLPVVNQVNVAASLRLLKT